MNLDQALHWASANNAVIRFNQNNEYAEQHSVRCTVVGHKEEDRIIAIQPLPDVALLTDVLAATITECADELERTRPVERALKVV